MQAELLYWIYIEHFIVTVKNKKDLISFCQDKIYTSKTDKFHLDHCREQKYTCKHDKLIYLIIQLQYIVTQKQHNCDTETKYVFWKYVSKNKNILAHRNIL